MTPRIVPVGVAQRLDVRVWNVRSFQVASYVTDSPVSARRCAAIGSNSGSVVLK